MNITDEQIEQTWNSMPDGPDGFRKSWGYLQFARAILDLREHPPFDEAAARAGKPIEGLNASKEWVPAHFVGVTRQGRIVIEFHDLCIVQLRPDEVRMAAPKMRTLYLNVYASNIGASGFNKAAIEKCAGPGCAHIAYPVEVPE